MFYFIYNIVYNIDMKTIIDQYNELVKLSIYPSQKEWYSKYNYHGIDYDKLLEYKKHHLKNIPLLSESNSLYYNEAFIIPKVKAFYDQLILKFDQFEYFSEQIESILIFSEVEHSIEIEGIKSSRKKIQTILDQDNLATIDKQIILNMKNGIDFIYENEISSENIHKLYQILSYKSLDSDEQIESIYRTESVDIIGFYGEISDSGIDPKYLPDYMNTLIEFIQKQLSIKNEFTYLMPLIIHYIIVYYHPYYDFNGRMARMLAYWFTLQCKFIELKFPIFSEAINYNKKSKNLYYKGIENAREDDNDLSFFISTLLDLANPLVNTYYKLYISLQLSIQNQTPLSENELSALKTIYLNIESDKVFTWEQFHIFSKEQYSKQYNLKMLNGLVEKKLLKIIKNKKVNFYSYI